MFSVTTSQFQTDQQVFDRKAACNDFGLLQKRPEHRAIKILRVVESFAVPAFQRHWINRANKIHELIAVQLLTAGPHPDVIPTGGAIGLLFAFRYTNYQKIVALVFEGAYVDRNWRIASPAGTVDLRKELIAYRYTFDFFGVGHAHVNPTALGVGKTNDLFCQRI
ncbi:MAG: hypothetical protein A2992_07430 [Elusimicrobia bacterium RIFCSPLOWO2_01_FULL_59_12]|nr:MAG: hypothetical protein A2992_07430 [Elusimicrobia bacterium RIFCSPLOWO2_01_FULL_59_12]